MFGRSQTMVFGAGKVASFQATTKTASDAIPIHAGARKYGRMGCTESEFNRIVQGGGAPLPEAARVEFLDEVRIAGSTQLGKVKEIAYVRPTLIVFVEA